MNADHLVHMANQIAQFFEAQPDPAAAVLGVRDHLKKFWDPRMRKKIVEHLESGGEGMRDLTRAAVQLLAEEQVKKAAA